MPTWDDESREFALSCAADGTVRWADARAARLQLQPGERLHARAVPGTEEKLSRFFTRAQSEICANVEQSLVLAGRVVTCSFHAKPDGEGGVLLLGSRLPDDHHRTLGQVAESIEEMQTLNREIVRQK